MIIMIFGISCVGKTTTGKMLAEKLKYSFFDLDDELKETFKTTIEIFIKEYPYSYDRAVIKCEIIENLIEKYKDNIVIAVSTIHHSEFFDSLVELENVFAIELQDKKEHIFERLIFSDANDNVIEDDTYKEKHKEYYIRDIHEDIIYSKELFKNIKNRYFIDNKPICQVVDDLIDIIKDI